MDSLTQVVLGAAVGEATLGKKVGNRAMLWGAIAGTIPDMDVFLKYFVDAISATEMHRGFSHSLLFGVLFAPIFGWLIRKHERYFLYGFFSILLSALIVGSDSILMQLVLAVDNILLIFAKQSLHIAAKLSDDPPKSHRLVT